MKPLLLLCLSIPVWLQAQLPEPCDPSIAAGLKQEFTPWKLYLWITARLNDCGLSLSGNNYGRHHCNTPFEGAFCHAW